MQNGRALKSRFKSYDKKLNLFADYYFINGSYVKDFFSKRLKSNYITTGSIIGNHFKKCQIEKVNTIQWISQYRLYDIKSKFGFQKNFENLSIKTLLVIKKFCKKNNLSLEVISNTGKNIEKEFYDNILEDYYFLKIDKDKNPYGSYSNLKSNAIIAGVDSQFLYEVFSLGYRAAFFTSLGTLMNDSSRDFSWPNKVPDFGPFWANKFDSKKYSLILINLMKADKSEILSYYEKYSGVMFYDFSNSKIKKILKNEGI